MNKIHLVVIITVIVLVVLIAIYCERKRRLQTIYQFGEPKDCCSECPIGACVEPAQPILQEIPTLIMGFGEGDGLFFPPFQTGPNLYNFPFIEVRPDFIPTTCTTDRPLGFPTSNFVAGTVQLDPSNSNPQGGYIMSTVTDQKDYTQTYAQVAMSSALTQAEVDSGKFFIWGMPMNNIDFPAPFYSVATYAISKWIDLGATFTIFDDKLYVNWNQLDVSSCDLGEWEIVVTARDSTVVCGGFGFTYNYPNMNLGDTVSIDQTSLVIQLNSGLGGITHNITQCAAYAYPICNRSPGRIFYVQSTDLIP
uniref:Uncharacterized protein n=1 Tax=viral metagenome TaxID=1070528 RepID=A0A6C0CI96_9ZZZZ